METFENMLDNLYSNLELKNSKLDIVLPTPTLVKSGNKTIWKNIKDFLKLFNRDPNHFLHFINNDTSSKVCWLSDSKTDGCIFETKTKKEQIFDIMKKYIKEDILCKSCKNIDTVLEKNKELRKYKLKCNNCKNEYFI
jgi:translation initiation factor 2 beta subunit (eIF-2beta)/eIF-5